MTVWPVRNVKSINFRAYSQRYIVKMATNLDVCEPRRIDIGREVGTGSVVLVLARPLVKYNYIYISIFPPTCSLMYIFLSAS